MTRTDVLRVLLEVGLNHPDGWPPGVLPDEEAAQEEEEG